MLPQENVRDITQQVWDMTFPYALSFSEEDLTSLDTGNTHTGCVKIGEPFNAVIAVRCTAGLGERIAKIFFGSDSEISAENIVDTLAELANMIGGNIKAALSGGDEPAKLSTPAVIEHEDYISCFPPSWITVRVPFKCADDYVEVLVLLASEQ